jgi:hypothetical protein
MAGKHARALRAVAPVHAAEEEIREYSSKDVEFDWPEPYEPPYPLNEREVQLLELNQQQKADVAAWLKNKTQPVVDEELGNGAES